MAPLAILMGGPINFCSTTEETKHSSGYTQVFGYCPNGDIADDITRAFPEGVWTLRCKRNKIDFFHTVFERIPVIDRVEVERASVKPDLI